MKESDDNNRRSFLRKIFTLTASAGVAGLLLDRLPGKEVVQTVRADNPMEIDTANSGSSTTSLTSMGNAALMATNTSNGAALQGTCTAGTGVLGTTTTGTGVQGTSSDPAGTGVSGFASGGGTGMKGLSDTGVPVLATTSGFEEFQFIKLGGTQPSRIHATGDGINRFAVNQSFDGTNFNLDDTSKNGVSFLINSNPSASGIFAIQYIPSGSNPATSRLKSYLFMKANGNVGIGTNSPAHLIQLSGGAYSDGTSWTSVSSVRWKENIEPLTDGVDMLKQLHPVAYNYKKTPAKRTMGFIAEEVGKVLPSVVDWDKAEPGYAEGYDHLAILALAVQAVREQQSEISEQKSTIQQLQERTAFLEQKVKQLTAT